MKKTTILILLTMLVIFGLGRTALADSVVLSISPASTDKIVNKTFNLSVQMDSSSNKTCVIKGTLVFDNLACQSITVADGLMIQTFPSCASPSFVIGVPKCVATVQNILSVSVKGTKSGQGSLSLASVKTIGAGIDVPFRIEGGFYNISEVKVITEPLVKPVVEPIIEEPVTAPTTPVAELFDIALTIENALLDKSSDLMARTQFTSFGTVPTLVNLVYRIEDTSGNEVFTENGEITVETEQTVTKEFKNLNLANGQYTLILITTYGDNVRDEFKQAFEVKGIAPAQGGSTTTIWLISILLIVGIGIGIIYLFIKRK